MWSASNINGEFSESDVTTGNSLRAINTTVLLHYAWNSSLAFDYWPHPEQTLVFAPSQVFVVALRGQGSVTGIVDFEEIEVKSDLFPPMLG